MKYSAFGQIKCWNWMAQIKIYFSFSDSFLYFSFGAIMSDISSSLILLASKPVSMVRSWLQLSVLYHLCMTYIYDICVWHMIYLYFGNTIHRNYILQLIQIDQNNSDFHLVFMLDSVHDMCVWHTCMTCMYDICVWHTL